ncbi:MAG TPA: sensor domain-containing diguanylate cyclase [Gemmatimonadaceae bacterium]|nr:sensor domain-containing diguanylate cyclase [Gemmatimonadaceae bacterium]
MMHSLLIAVVPATIGALASWLVMRASAARRQRAEALRPAVTRLEAHMAGSQGAPNMPSAKSAALRRDVQHVFETKEASQDLEVLDRLLRDIRDLTNAEEAIFWRWMEERQTLVPSAWSTDGQSRPAFFDVNAWASLVRWSAEEGEMQFAGDVGGRPVLASSPVNGPAGVYGVLTVSAATGIRLDRKEAKSWMPRYSAQVASLIQLFDLRREYALHMRRSDALLDAVQRLHGHRRAEALAEALCETAQEVTSATTAGLVHWSALDRHGMVQAITPSSDIEPGFHVTADTLVGRVCTELLPIILEDAASATALHCPYGGLPRPIGSLAIIPILSGDHAIGALVVEGKEAGSIAQHEGRNIGLLAAVARGPLEIIWEIEEVSRRARTDSLTGLANRRHFDEALRRVIAETDRFGGTCSLIMVDLDHFKQVNDRHGHDAGDTVLRHVALVLGEAIRTVDLCARYGGEEIALLLPQTSPQGALELAERLRATLETRPAMRRGEPISVTASFGVATYPTPVPSGDWLLLAADKALYEAKASGRNCVKVIQTNQVNPALYKSL